MVSESERCHLKARVTANYIEARPLNEDSEDLELENMMSEECDDEYENEQDE